MRLRFTEQRSTGIAIALAAAFVLAWTAPRAEAAEKLTQKTRQAWETYEKLTEKRIFETELKDTSRFLHLDFMTAPESRKAREVLKSGNVHVQKMTTLDDKGKPIPADDGLFHHWYGAVFIPGVKVDALLRWIQDYNSTSKYFKEVKESKLLPPMSGDSADTYRIFFRVRRTVAKLLTVNYNTWHTVVYRSHGAGQTSSSSRTTKIAELSNAGTSSEK